jgi:hypothetical protein
MARSRLFDDRNTSFGVFMARHFVSAAVVVFLFAVALLPATAATPKEAVGFFGMVTGSVKTAEADGASFVLTVSKAVADEKTSKVKDTAAMVGKELTLGTRMPRTKEGKPHPNPEDVAYIKTLKPGDEIVVQVFAVHANPAVLRMVKPGESARK